jgi:NAD(P)H-dependent FMN reductase
MTVKLLAFSGSSREGSMNRKLLEAVIKVVEKNGAKVTHLHLPDFNLPLYDGDVEAKGMPEGAVKLKELFNSHDGYLIASPEYNGGYSGLLKNTIDWVSRGGMTKEFKGKIAGLVATAPGKLGGLRGLYQLNTILFGLGVLVLPNIVSIGFYKEAFDGEGQLTQDNDRAAVNTLGERIVTITQALKTPAI